MNKNMRKGERMIIFIRNAEATAQLRQALEGLTVKSLFDFIGRTEIEKYS
ncbi:hypothetical protein J7E32_14455 [Bacillus sp. ISL-55]|nr:hypothetical protein [Bacillus sp. ISL-55]